MLPTRRRLLTTLAAWAVVGGVPAARAGGEDCFLMDGHQVVLGAVIPPDGVVTWLAPTERFIWGPGSGHAVSEFWFEGRGGEQVEARVEVFPSARWRERASVSYRWSPVHPLRGGRSYRLMGRASGGRPAQVLLPTWRNEVAVVRRWAAPPPGPLRVEGVLLEEGIVGEPCRLPRRKLVVRIAEVEVDPPGALTGKGLGIGSRMFEVRIARPPQSVDLVRPPDFLLPLQDAGLVFDLLHVGEQSDAFLPRYACTIGLREFDAAGRLGPPFELAVPAAPEVPGLPEEAWWPFGR